MKTWTAALLVVALAVLAATCSDSDEDKCGGTFYCGIESYSQEGDQVTVTGTITNSRSEMAAAVLVAYVRAAMTAINYQEFTVRLSVSALLADCCTANAADESSPDPYCHQCRDADADGQVYVRPMVAVINDCGREVPAKPRGEPFWILVDPKEAQDALNDDDNDDNDDNDDDNDDNDDNNDNDDNDDESPAAEDELASLDGDDDFDGAAA
jgi:hypothetical protein